MRKIPVQQQKNKDKKQEISKIFCTRGNKYSSKFDISCSFVAIFTKSIRNMKLKRHDMGNGITAFSTMRGTIAEGAYCGFNITHYCGDSNEHVAECRRELCAMLGIDNEHLILPRQTHEEKVVHIDREFLERSPEEQKKILHGVDAIVTRLRRVCIGVSSADCVPLLLCDRRQRVIAAVHAGWRGTVRRIAEICAKEMIARYACNPADIHAVIGPSIGLEAFEVGNEVCEAFSKAGFPMKQVAALRAKWHINLWEANRWLLMQCGIPNWNIKITGICTHTNHKEWFSARRLGINSGRIFNGIMIE